MGQGFTPLHTAAAHSSHQAAAVLGDLLEAGADVEVPDQAGRTPLLLALEGNRKDAISALLAAGDASATPTSARRRHMGVFPASAATPR